MTSTIHEGMRLSPLRVVIAVVIVIGLAAASFFGLKSWTTQTQAAPSDEPWFAGYVDVTATPAYSFESASAKNAKNVMLSFVVSDGASACTPSWGGSYTMDEASTALDLDRRITRLQQRGGAVAVSFGGQANSELSVECSDHDSLVDAYSSVIERYGVTTIDLDIEGDELSNSAAGDRRAAAIAEVQADQRAAGKTLAVWLTLPASTNGLTAAGMIAVQQMLDGDVELAGVNLMTMNFGAGLGENQTLASAAEAALVAGHEQLSSIYRLAGTQLSPGAIWSKLAATPMIGQNDEPGEVFSLADATELNTFATQHGMGRMSMWSMNRDSTCAANYVDLKRVSDACSGVDQGTDRFTELLGESFEGTSIAMAHDVATSEPVDPGNIADDPATSPYPIWDEDSSYPKNSKVVWHHNVYQAKWWTLGEAPDDPMPAGQQSAWTYIGPVLPGEKPAQVTESAAGLYPDWDGTAIYLEGTRIVFDGVAYRARWWTQGDSPQAYAASPDSSAWVPLTMNEVKAALREASPTPTPSATVTPAP